ncbi:uncharacterized protein [Pithys albifrons albifrons]|uniref:uncharacterized protein n=1 Tax=Pithys albifrons albifrons TaxID=3385563 RepID=UPI003A5CCC03
MGNGDSRARGPVGNGDPQARGPMGKGTCSRGRSLRSGSNSPPSATSGRAGPTRGGEPGRAEPSQAEPSRAEPSRAEPSQAKPSLGERSRAGMSCAGMSRAGSAVRGAGHAPTCGSGDRAALPSPVEPHRAEPIQAEPCRAQPSPAQPSPPPPPLPGPPRTAPSGTGTASRPGAVPGTAGKGQGNGVTRAQHPSIGPEEVWGVRHPPPRTPVPVGNSRTGSGKSLSIPWEGTREPSLRD